jgi:hypothetical protein
MGIFEDTFAYDFQTGVEAHKAEIDRSENPHLRRAVMWDKGWVTSARGDEAKTPATTKIVGFKDWIALQ